MESVFNMLRPLHFVLLLSAFAFFAFASAVENKEVPVEAVETPATSNDLETEATSYWGGYQRPYYGWGGYGAGYGGYGAGGYGAGGYGLGYGRGYYPGNYRGYWGKPVTYGKGWGWGGYWG